MRQGWLSLFDEDMQNAMLIDLNHAPVDFWILIISWLPDCLSDSLGRYGCTRCLCDTQGDVVLHHCGLWPMKTSTHWGERYEEIEDDLEVVKCLVLLEVTCGQQRVLVLVFCMIESTMGPVEDMFPIKSDLYFTVFHRWDLFSNLTSGLGSSRDSQVQQPDSTRRWSQRRRWWFFAMIVPQRISLSTY